MQPDVLTQTSRLARTADTFVLYDVGNEFDADFAALKGKPLIAGYPVKRKFALTRTEVAPLLTQLTARKSYFAPGVGLTCLFEPHHVLEIRSSNRSELVVICVKCGDVQFLANGKEEMLKSLLPAPNDSIARLLAKLDRKR